MHYLIGLFVTVFALTFGISKAMAQSLVIIALLCEVPAGSGPTVSNLQASEFVCDGTNVDLCNVVDTIEPGGSCAQALADLLGAGGKLATRPVSVAPSVPAEDLLILRENDVVAVLNANGVPFRPHTDVIYSIQGDNDVRLVGCALLGSTLTSTFEQPESAVPSAEPCADVIVRGFDPSKKLQIVPTSARSGFSGTYFVESVEHTFDQPPKRRVLNFYTIAVGVD